MGVEQKRGEGTQRFYKGGSKLGQGVGALKKGGGLEPPCKPGGPHGKPTAMLSPCLWNFPSNVKKDSDVVILMNF